MVMAGVANSNSSLQPGHLYTYLAVSVNDISKLLNITLGSLRKCFLCFYLLHARNVFYWLTGNIQL